MRGKEFSGINFVNDLERPVFEKFVLLGYLKTWLRLQPDVGAALMSGSGSTVFAVVRSGADRTRLAERIREEVDQRIWTFACETV
jgi:4-diphosphocytidyl-2-C-methyl-D-erythritol kinase